MRPAWQRLPPFTGPASAAHLDYYTAYIEPLSGSGVSGKANLALNNDDGTLAVHVMASGLEPGMPHVQHIHGAFGGGTSGTPVASKTPTLAQDTDKDGIIELAEGAKVYGPIIVPLSSPPGGALADFPTAPGGSIDFSEVYNLNDPATFAAIPDGDDDPTNDVKYTKGDLLPLFLREIVLHGGFDPIGVGDGTGGEIDGNTEVEYEAVLPVAAGAFRVADANFNVIPLPAAGWMLLSAMAGLGLLGGTGRARRKA